jgi:transcriptional regulator GlxA family with amidase domain
MRVDSSQMNLIADALNVENNPVFSLGTTNAVGLFDDILRVLRDRPLTMDALLHASISCLMALLFEARQSGTDGRKPDFLGAPATPEFAVVLTKMRIDHRRSWKINDLAQLAGISVPHFFRRFHQATGSSPMDWLRRERVNHAKRLLTETQNLVRDIADQVGYNDPFYFSRDFKKLVGLSPRRYRDRERAMASATQQSLDRSR